MNQESKILSGKSLSSDVFKNLSTRIDKLKNINIIPTLAVILVGDNPASSVYVKNKTTRFKKLNLNSFTVNYNDNVSEKELLNKISELNNDTNFNGKQI